MVWERKKTVLIEGSQASCALPSDKSGAEAKEIGMLRAEAVNTIVCE
jgi:hypothetical protein